MSWTTVPRFDDAGRTVRAGRTRGPARAARKHGSRVIACGFICSVRRLPTLVMLLVALLACTASRTALGQQSNPFPPENTLMIGLGGLPGLGTMVAYVSPARMYTREALVVADVIIPTGSRDGSGYVAVAIGGSVRIIGIGETLGLISPKKYDVDIGIRLGPALVFEFDETRADKNKRFNVAAEPFARFSRKLGGRQRTYFVEGGLIRPTLRVGIWLGF